MVSSDTNRDDELIAWIDYYLAEHKYAPALHEVGKRFALSSKSTVSHWLSRLKREDRVNWTPGESRTLHTVKWEDER